MATWLNFPFDPDIFNYKWENTPDVVLTNLLESGAVVNDSEIATLISTGSNFFTTPYYDILDGDEDVYNGVDNMTADELTGGSYSGVVYGRMKQFNAKSFIKDFNSGADPMEQIVAGVAQYWQKKRQTRLIAVIEAVFGITGDADWDLHKTNIATTGATADETNKMGVSTIGNAVVKANGDHADKYTLAFMHSVVANNLANLQLLNYAKYTDPAGIQRELRLATINGMIVVITDQVPATASATASGEIDYTTYILGLGAIRYAKAPVEIPSEMDRDPATNGGVDKLFTRVRECFAPYGFSFKGDHTTDVGIPDAVLTASASWERKMPAKSVYMVKVVTNG